LLAISAAIHPPKEALDDDEVAQAELFDHVE
jgi:hypothetical protein